MRKDAQYLPVTKARFTCSADSCNDDRICLLRHVLTVAARLGSFGCLSISAEVVMFPENADCDWGQFEQDLKMFSDAQGVRAHIVEVSSGQIA